MKKTIPFLAASLSLSISLFSQSSRYYVDQAATGQNNGQSWPDAFADLHDALALAEAGDEVWVAQGTYRPSTTGARSARFQVLSGVRLYGGFAATELDLSERNWQAHPTVLDGDIGVPEDSTDNSYNLLYLYRPDSLTLVDGLTFRHALANDPVAAAGALGSSGAALYIMAFDGAAYPTVRNCVFEQNTALKHGGAVYVNGGGSGSVAPVFEQCRFRANRAAQGIGGALYRNGGSWVDRPEDINGCVFEENSANLYGGAIYFADSQRSDTFDIVKTTFLCNQIVVSLATNLVHSGSAIYITSTRLNDATTISLRQSNIINHKRIIEEAAVQSVSASFATSPQGFEAGNLIVDFDSVYFEGNRSTIYCELFGWMRIIINNSIFCEDTMGINIYAEVDHDTTKIENTIFYRSVGMGFNSGSSTLYIENVTCAYNWGMAFGMHLPSNVEIIANNLNVYGNIFSSPQFGGGTLYKSGVFLNADTYAVGGSWKGTARINNSSAHDNFIIGGVNTKNVVYRNNAFYLEESGYFPQFGFISRYGHTETAVFDNNLINLPDTFNAPIWIKTNNLWDTDPQFVNPDSGDFRLQPCSPAINAGNNAAVITSTDIFGSPRIQHGTVDIGAVEMGNLAFATGSSPVVQADCAGGAGGSITASGLEACSPLQYEWGHAPGLDTPNLSGLSAGAYSLTATDARGRSVVLNFSIPAANPPTLQVDGQPISCFGADDAMLSVTPLTGQPPFAYLWSPSGTTDSVATGLGPGPVSVTVTDAWGCAASFAFDVPQPDTLQFAATVQDASGSQTADGSILVNNVTGGTAPYSYLWEPGGSMESMLNNLNPGLYTLTVTDERGCEAAWTFEVKAIVGTGEAGGQALLLTYPNPAGESATVAGDFSEKMPTVLELYDAAGRSVRSLALASSGGESSVWQLPLDGLAAGQYTVLLRGADGKVVGAGRLVKR